MDGYDFVRNARVLYGILWVCMDFWTFVLILVVPFLWFS